MTKKQFEQYRFGIKTRVRLEDKSIIDVDRDPWYPIFFVDYEDTGVGIRDTFGVRFIYYKQIKSLKD